MDRCEGLVFTEREWALLWYRQQDGTERWGPGERSTEILPHSQARKDVQEHSKKCLSKTIIPDDLS